MNRFQINSGVIASILSVALLAACSDDDNKSTNNPDSGGGGGETSAGGSKGSGGGKAAGGSGTSTGGGKATGGGSSAGGSKSAGGSTGTGGNETDGGEEGGSVKDGGSDAETHPDAGAVCDQYCEDILATCTGANKQFDTEGECIEACAGYDRSGTPGATGGNSLQCRLYHLDAAKTDANTHCGHAGPTGNGMCVGAVQ